MLQMLEYNKVPTLDFLLNVLTSLKDADMFDYYRKIIHHKVDSIELWNYYIEYCVETQRITEILESLEYYKTKSVIGSQIKDLYNKLAASQIRYTIFQNQ